jgi:hypothetical protein
MADKDAPEKKDTEKAEKKFNPKWLEGLKFSFAEKEMIEKNGRKTLKATPKKRPLKEEDLLSWKDYGDRVVIATNDGKKYTVKK